MVDLDVMLEQGVGGCWWQLHLENCMGWIEYHFDYRADLSLCFREFLIFWFFHLKVEKTCIFPPTLYSVVDFFTHSINFVRIMFFKKFKNLASMFVALFSKICNKMS